MTPNPSVTPHTIDNDTPAPTKLSPADFQAEAEQFNAKAAEIAKAITDEHARHANLLAEIVARQEDHAASRKALIARAGSFGMTAAYCRSLLRKG